MPYPYFSRNGEVLPVEKAMIPLNRVEYSYGFGVYENIRVSRGQALFIDDHCQRLMKSAEIIGLDHIFTTESVEKYILELISQNRVEACNIKILLIGGTTAKQASLDILCLNPLYPDRKLYKDGAKVITYNYERQFPQAKTLNMLSSYLAYRNARSVGAYDALLINRNGEVTEGTRTNFFGLKDKLITSPPADQILLGVTRDKIIEVAIKNGFEINEQPIKLDGLDKYDSIFLTSTSSKIMPISQVENGPTLQISSSLRELMNSFHDSVD